MLKNIPARADGKNLHVEEISIDGNGEGGTFVLPVFSRIAENHGNFKTVTTTVAGTFTITNPNIDGAIILTDILLSAEKKASGAVEIRFTDDINTETIFKPIVTDGPTAVGIPLNGRWRGWKNARLDVVVTADVDTSVAVGYYKVKNGLPFEDWDARR